MRPAKIGADAHADLATRLAKRFAQGQYQREQDPADATIELGRTIYSAICGQIVRAAAGESVAPPRQTMQRAMPGWPAIKTPAEAA